MSDRNRDYDEQYDFKMVNGGPILLSAAADGAVRTLTKLMEAGVSPDCSDINGNTPLHLAAREEHTMSVAKLISFGASLNRREKSAGYTPLHLAVKSGYERVVLALVEFGADMDIRDDYGLTALHHAASEGLSDIAVRLIGLGADPNAENKFRQTPFQMAAAGEYKKTLRAMRDAIEKRWASRNMPTAVSDMIDLFIKLMESGNLPSWAKSGWVQPLVARLISPRPARPRPYPCPCLLVR